jgi:DNA mismatch endonuclease (patch repair protein)
MPAGGGLDKIDSERRSRNMSAIRSADTAPELRLRRALWRNGVRGYRLHRSGILGRPDIVFGPSKVAVFVDGCFWHGCPRCYRPPSSNSKYWSEKAARNRARDDRVNRDLSEHGWLVLRLWEHEIEDDTDACVARIQAAVCNGLALDRRPRP